MVVVVVEEERFEKIFKEKKRIHLILKNTTVNEKYKLILIIFHLYFISIFFPNKCAFLFIYSSLCKVKVFVVVKVMAAAAAAVLVMV